MKTREQIIQELREMSDRMVCLGVDIQYFAGFNTELAEKGHEMIGSGQIVEELADEIEKNK